MSSKKISLDLVALCEYSELIQKVSERLSGTARKKFAKELATFLQIETISGFITKHENIVSYIDDLIDLVGDQILDTVPSFSRKKIEKDTSELEIVRDILGKPNLSTTEEVAKELIASGKLITLGEFIKQSFEAKSGLFFSFIELPPVVLGQQRVAIVSADWGGNKIFIRWCQFLPTYKWTLGYELIYGSKD